MPEPGGTEGQSPITKPLAQEPFVTRAVNFVKGKLGFTPPDNPLAAHEKRDPDALFNRVNRQKEKERKRQRKFGV